MEYRESGGEEMEVSFNKRCFRKWSFVCTNWRRPRRPKCEPKLQLPTAISSGRRQVGEIIDNLVGGFALCPKLKVLIHK